MSNNFKVKMYMNYTQYISQIDNRKNIQVKSWYPTNHDVNHVSKLMTQGIYT